MGSQQSSTTGSTLDSEPNPLKGKFTINGTYINTTPQVESGGSVSHVKSQVRRRVIHRQHTCII